MSAPERIWAFYSDIFGAMWTGVKDEGADEYIRADLIPATPLSAALAVPEVLALVEALRVARAHVANNAEGWSVSRGASRDDLTIVDAALRGLEDRP